MQCKPAKLVMHRSETSPAGSGGSTAGRALDPAGGGNGRPAQIRLPRASRLAAAGQGARLAGPPDPPGHLEPEFSGLNLHYVPLPRTVNGTGHTGPSEFCATSI